MPKEYLHKSYKEKADRDLDKLPKQLKRKLNKSERQYSKSEIRRLRLQLPPIEYEVELNKHIDEALHCYSYGPCDKCLENQE